jgi:serine-type D-Ala-D-Ala carboxypeptidase (penicillin-binding protein 5/6)
MRADGTRRVYRSGGRRRKNALGLVALAAAVVLVLTLAAPRLGGQGTRTAHRVERLPDTGKAVDLAWPGEGEAAVAVNGVGFLGAVGSGDPVPIASLAKVMTAYLILRDDPLGKREEGFEITIGPGDVEDLERRRDLGQSVVPVEVGEVLTERQALEALLLPSANNVAALLAVHEAGSAEAFVEEMNEAADELGMSRTTYTDPSGFEDSTVSTARDQLKIARAAMADPTFREIVAMPSTTLPVVGEVANFNELVGQEGFIGIKTGSDSAAGGCLLFARRIQTQNHTHTIVGAILGQRDGDLIPAALTATRTLTDSVAAALR